MQPKVADKYKFGNSKTQNKHEKHIKNTSFGNWFWNINLRSLKSWNASITVSQHAESIFNVFRSQQNLYMGQSEAIPFVTLSRSRFQDPDSKSSYLEIDESSGSLVFEIRFSWLSAFRFGIFCQFSAPKSRDMIKMNRHLNSIDLVEIYRSVVESSKMDLLRSVFDHFEISNEFWCILVNLLIFVNFNEFCGFGEF